MNPRKLYVINNEQTQALLRSPGASIFSEILSLLAYPPLFSTVALKILYLSLSLSPTFTFTLALHLKVPTLIVHVVHILDRFPCRDAWFANPAFRSRGTRYNE